MADKMNFGPEWLRNLSSEGESSGPKYQLAEFRYGREEMLILFDKNIKPPENLSRFQDLFVEKIQTPVSFLPMSEEETVMDYNFFLFGVDFKGFAEIVEPRGDYGHGDAAWGQSAAARAAWGRAQGTRRQHRPWTR